MSYCLGIDTSNYTTSAALYDPMSGVIHKKKLLPVKQGECGLRQSDAVFHHTQQLPMIVDELLKDFSGNITAIGVSSRPRDVEGSYMPCFTVGLGAAKILSSTMKLPMYTFSHQSGHIAAAAYSAGNLELLNNKHIAFHVSGGTTEAVLVTPCKDKIFKAEIAARTLDLNAGQLIDRIGVMLGLGFPCGAELERLAEKSTSTPKVKATLKGADCCLSGIENICRRAYESGTSKEDIALLCLMYVEKTLECMCKELLKLHGELPVIFAGGVMSDRIIKTRLSEKFSAYFAEPEFSADNAAGIAILTDMQRRVGKQVT